MNMWGLLNESLLVDYHTYLLCPLKNYYYYLKK